MKKLYVSGIILFIMMMGSVLAATEGNVSVYSFKVYEDGGRLDGGWSDDEFRINAGTNLEIQIRYDNPYNDSITVDTKGILYDIGGDIERDDSVIIEKDSRGEAIVFEYYIPSDTRNGGYDYVIEYKYDYDGNEYKHEKTFEFSITEEQVDINKILLNITRNLADSKSESNDLMSTVLNLSGTAQALGDCKSKLGKLEEKTENNEEFKDKYFRELNTSKSYMERYATCDGQRLSMYSQGQVDDKISNAEGKAKRQQKKEDDNFLLMVVASGGIWIYFKRKKEVVGGGGEGKPLTGTWK